MPDSEGRRSVAVPAVMLGIGLGGAIDGIVLHQLLQWHHLLTSVEGYPASTVDGLETNTWADGVFHAVAYAVVVAGVIALWSRLRAGAEAGWRSLVGWALVGWGAFNLVEGIVDHHLLGIHHVRAGPDHLLYDLGFLALGAILVVVGWALARSERRQDGRRNAAEGVLAPPGRAVSFEELRDGRR